MSQLLALVPIIREHAIKDWLVPSNANRRSITVTIKYLMAMEPDQLGRQFMNRLIGLCQGTFHAIRHRPMPTVFMH
jgi:hypothetical protein